MGMPACPVQRNQAGVCTSVRSIASRILLLVLLGVGANAQALVTVDDVRLGYTPAYLDPADQRVYAAGLAWKLSVDDDPRAIIDLTELLGTILIDQGHSERALTVLNAGKRLAVELADGMRIASIEGQLGRAAFYLSSNELGLSQASAALQRQELLKTARDQHPDPDRMFRQMMDLAALLAEVRHTGALAQLLKRSASLLDQLGNREAAMLDYEYLLSAVHEQIGDLEQASKLLDSALERAHRLELRQWEATALLSQASISMGRLRYAEAIPLLEQAWRLATHDEALLEQSSAAGLIADCNLELNQPLEALRWARIQQPLADSTDDPLQRSSVRLAQAEALAALNRPAEARGLLAKARDLRLGQTSEGWLRAVAAVQVRIALSEQNYPALQQALLEEKIHRDNAEREKQAQRVAAVRELYNLNERDYRNVLLERENALKELELKRTSDRILTQRLVLILSALVGVGLLVVLALVVRRMRRYRMRAETDALTGAMSRPAIEQFARRAFSQARGSGERLSIIMMDMDKFKFVNDTFGHAVGDQVLRNTVLVAKAALRKGDSIGRIGGDEFLIVLPGANREQATIVARRIHASLHMGDANTGALQGFTTASMGLATIEGGILSMDQLIQLADHALLAAKQGGRDRIESEPARVAAVPPG